MKETKSNVRAAHGNTSEEQMAKLMALMGPLEGISDNFRRDGKATTVTKI